MKFEKIFNAIYDAIDDPQAFLVCIFVSNYLQGTNEQNKTGVDLEDIKLVSKLNTKLP